MGLLWPLLRRYEFPGKRRLRLRLPVPTSGVEVVRFPEGMALRLDLSESLQRDYYAGLHDAFELRLVRRLVRGGDFVDVGAHIGLYTVFAARHARHVLAIEPNAHARAQLEENVRLNACDNVTIVAAAASAHVGEAELAVPRTNDPSFSTLEGAGFESQRVRVATTTVDREVERRGVEPALVKIDVQDHEVAVLEGMERTLERGPAVLCEVGVDTAEAIRALLAGWTAYRVGARRLAPLGDVDGYVNALFLPPGYDSIA